ncbi:RecQ family ATP-dependent DNA helicase [Secundilactobacillus malefermentans]|uniref:RecQ family ATP-dependent DNA helicase n=1 Tax=Secundilactobacillus malefermentans TaxID=176292 RepID=UPI0011CC36EE|nr:RecQ family ATP-dependent DNA helicase [Secundilactobacillus malefermentans]QEA32329.1 ATP-dependent DNA helicase RecQ [Secundilactobacillus malefermentans]
MLNRAQLHAELKRYTGFDEFRDGQEAAVTSLLANQDTLAILPTGAGKSLIYELYGKISNRLVIIISPLLSLMQDQVSSLNYRGERRAVAYTSLLMGQDKAYIEAHLNQYRFLFMSPEMLVNDAIFNRIKQLQPGLLVIDEAHCISTWGPDFRPEYLLLGKLRERLGSPLTLMLTATATPKIKLDIKAKMGLPDATEVMTTIDRPNIFIGVQHVDSAKDKMNHLKQLISNLTMPGIIYFSSKKVANQVAEELNNELAINVAAYHADLSSDDRFKVQQQFMSNQIQLICATSAFGMGIDKNDIRFVIHYHMPSTLEDYWQEVGRAGRDGKQSVAIILYQKNDERIQLSLAESSLPTNEEIHLYYQNPSRFAKVDDDKFRLVKFYATHRVREDQLVQLLQKRQQSRTQSIREMVSYVNYAECKRELIGRHFKATIKDHDEKCCSNEITSEIIESLNLPEPAILDTTNPVKLDWKRVISNLFLLKN